MARGRVLVAKVGLDGHTTGAAVVARGLRDAGFEVIDLGTRITPAQAVTAAIQEDADVIGLSVLSGAHLHLAGRVMDELRQAGSGTPVVMGGTISGTDARELREMGIAEVFGPGSSVDDIVACMDRLVTARATGTPTGGVRR